MLANVQNNNNKVQTINNLPDTNNLVNMKIKFNSEVDKVNKPNKIIFSLNSKKLNKLNFQSREKYSFSQINSSIISF